MRLGFGDGGGGFGANLEKRENGQVFAVVVPAEEGSYARMHRPLSFSLSSDDDGATASGNGMTNLANTISSTRISAQTFPQFQFQHPSQTGVNG